MVTNKIKRHKGITYSGVMHKIRNGYYASRNCFYQRELEVIEARINSRMITDKDDIAMLIDLGFKIDQ